MVEQTVVIDRVHFLRKLSVVAPGMLINGGSYRCWICILFGDEKATVVFEQVGMLGIASIVKMYLAVSDS